MISFSQIDHKQNST